MKTFIAVFVVITVSVAALANVHKIHAWEKANDYPFGKLCDLYRNCR